MRAYERLLNYVQFDTASDENSPSCPSTAKQLVLARALVDELQSAVLEKDNAAAQTLCAKVEATLAGRNRMCKLNK